MIEFTFRPIERWPQEPTPSSQRHHARFKVTYNKTLDLLSYELLRLGARKAYIQADAEESDIRLDGHLRSDRQPRSPRIIVAAQTKHGPISLPCDTYHDWKDNLRAIALSLEALRAVDRHGVTKRGEQYRGLKQIAGSSGPINSQEAATFIAKYCTDALGRTREHIAEILADVEVFRFCYRDAAKTLHPDKGGDPAEWAKLDSANVILSEHHGV